MVIRADVIWRALQDFGKLPKTFTVQKTTICTDGVSGKTRKKTDTWKYAPVAIVIDGKVVTVDTDNLKKFARKLGKNEISLTINNHLMVRHKSCEFTLFDLEATPGVTLNLDELLRPV